MAQIDIDLTDPKAARKWLNKAIREKKKQDSEDELRRERARIAAKVSAYETIQMFHTYKRLTHTKYGPTHAVFDNLVAAPPEERSNEFARYLDCPGGLVLFDFPNLEVKTVFVSPLGIRAIIARDHAIGRDRLLAIGVDDGMVGIADVFLVPVDVDADKPEPLTPETK